MLASTPRFATLALLVIVMGAATGCGSKTAPPVAPGETTPSVTTSTPGSGASSATAAAQTPAGSGAITTPTGSSNQRASIIKAAASALALRGQVVASQLFVRGGAAVGDLHNTAGQRVFVAVTGGPSVWKLAWSAPFGSATANAADLTAVDPEAFADLARAIDFKKKIADPTSAQHPDPTPGSFQTYARTSAKALAGTTYTGTFEIRAKIAKDSSGIWWGNALAEPSGSGLESIGVWGRWNGTAWKGEIADFSVDGADAAYFPADVLLKLAL